MNQRIKYNIIRQYRCIDNYIQNNELMVVCVDDKYLSIVRNNLTSDLEDAAVLHLYYAQFEHNLLINKYPYSSLDIRRYVDVYIKSNNNESKKTVSL